MNKSEIIEKAKEFEKSKKGRISRTKIGKARKRHRKFLNLYPFRENPRKIAELTPDVVYNPGTGKEYFFIWVEQRLGDLGRIGSWSAQPWINAKNNLEKFRELLKIAVDDSKSIAEKIDADWDKIPRFGGGRVIAKKIVSLYYLEDVVPIFNTEHMKHIANGLDIDLESECVKKYGESYENTSCGKAFELFNDLLLEIKRSSDVLKEWDNTFFMHFLYTTLRPPKRKVATRKERVGKTELKILAAKFKEGKISEEEFVETVSKKSLSPILLKLLKKIGIAWDEPHDPYEQEVVSLFSKLHKELGFPYIKTVRDAFPDAIVVDKNNEEKRIEFKVFASDFNYDPKGCDFIVCWEDDWGKEKPKNLPEIISLKTFILKNLL